MRIYLAATNGAFNKQDREIFIAKGKPLYQLCTFVEGEKNCLKNMNEVGNGNFILDSGAFSFMSGKEVDTKILSEYVEQYIDFIKKNNVLQYMEMDVDTMFGIQYVEEIRKKMERETGRQCIPVWHKGRGIEYWKRMVADYSYVAIGGLVFHVKQSEWGNIQKMVDYASKRGVKVHGLGFTKTKLLDNYKFYSVDSSSWVTSAVRGQQIHTFNGHCIETRMLDSKGMKANISKIALNNGLEWCKYQRYMNMR